MNTKAQAVKEATEAVVEAASLIPSHSDEFEIDGSMAIVVDIDCIANLNDALEALEQAEDMPDDKLVSAWRPI